MESREGELSTHGMFQRQLLIEAVKTQKSQSEYPFLEHELLFAEMIGSKA